MICKLFSIVISYCSDALRQRGEACDDGLADQLRSLAGDVREDCKPAFALNERHDRLLVARTNHGVALPVAHLTASLNRGWTLGNGPSTNDLPTTLSPAYITFAHLFLTTKVFPKRPALGLVSIDMLVNRFVANRQ